MQVLAITLPIFLLIGLGYLITWRGLLTPDQVRGLGLVVINVALPALLFRLLSRYRLHDLLEWRYFLVYATASFVMLVGFFLYWRRAEGCARPVAAVRAFGVSLANSGFIGLPIATQALGPHVGVALALTFTVESLIVIPGLLILGHETGGAPPAQVARQIALGLARSPLVIAILVAVASIILGLQPVPPIAKALDMLGAASAPVALLAIGGSLVRLQVRGLKGAVARICFGKLVLHPLAVGVMLLLVPIADPDLRHGALLLASAPMGSSFPIFGQRAGDGPLTAAALLAGTVSAFFTMNLMLWLIHSGWLG